VDALRIRCRTSYVTTMQPSYKPVNCGFRVRLMSPLGVYPSQSIVLEDVAFVVSSDLCFSIVRIEEEEWDADVDSLSPLDIPLFGRSPLVRGGLPVSCERAVA
jgi:hypothetical protein